MHIRKPHFTERPTRASERLGRDRSASQRGSALVMALFVMVVIGTTATSLLFLTQNEQTMALAYVRAKKAYYLAEAGEEYGRVTVFAPGTTLSDQLDAVAGPNGVIDFDPDNLVPVYDVSGYLTGFTGYGDDVPLRDATVLGDGWYASFLTNDVAEGATTTADTNGLVVVTGVGAGRQRSTEFAQAVIQSRPFPALPATITILGPQADFQGGSSDAKFYSGNDSGVHCPGGQPGVFVPTVGVAGSVAETSAEAGVIKPVTYQQGSETGVDTVDDLTLLSGLDPIVTDCTSLVEFVRELKDIAEIRGDSLTPESELGVPGSPRMVFIEGDYTIGGSFLGAGLLVVTGRLVLDGGVGWQGAILVVGDGNVDRSGGGNGTVSGGMLVADVEGPDGALFTADDCAGPDNVPGNSDDGVAQSTFSTSGGGNGTFGYCTTYLDQLGNLFPLRIQSFRQG